VVVTNIIVTTVKTSTVFPCFVVCSACTAVSSACFLADLASEAFACFCFKSSK
jgi:hypothetical protein